MPRVAWRREPSGIVASSMGRATEMCFPDRWANQTTKVVLLLGPLRVLEQLQVADENLLEDVEELRFLFDELRLDRLVEVLVRHRVVQDPNVRVILQDRLDFNLVHVLLDDLRDRRDLPERGLHDAADLRGLHLDAPVAEQAAEVPLLDRVKGAEDGGLAVLLEIVEHLLRLA